MKKPVLPSRLRLLPELSGVYSVETVPTTAWGDLPTASGEARVPDLVSRALVSWSRVASVYNFTKSGKVAVVSSVEAFDATRVEINSWAYGLDDSRKTSSAAIPDHWHDEIHAWPLLLHYWCQQSSVPSPAHAILTRLRDDGIYSRGFMISSRSVLISFVWCHVG